MLSAPQTTHTDSQMTTPIAPTTLITGAICVFPEETRPSNILLKGGLIDTIDAPDTTPADETVDASGLHLIPGVIDHHVHFREPGVTHKEDLAHGSRACAKGGVTTFFEMPNTVPHAVDQAGIDQKLAIAQKQSRVNFGFYIGATPTNTDELRNAERTPGIKIFIGSSTGDLLVDDQDDLERIFAETTLQICAHCEDEATVQRNTARFAAQGFPGGYADHSKVRDHEAALITTRRAIDLATRHNHPFHVLHVSTAAEIDPIRAARGIVTAEVCPHHLHFTIDDYERLGSLVQMNPSVKTKEDAEALWAALADGSIHASVTDHAPHTLEEKAKPYPESPSGVPAVENALPLMLDAVNKGRLTIERLVRVMCEAPALIWNIVNKGRIAEGYDADLVLVDLNKTDTVRNADQLTKCGWSPWHGTELTGWPVRTWVLGHTAFADGRLVDEIRGQPARFDHSRGGYWASERTA